MGMEMSDTYQVSGMKAWVITKMAKYLAVKEIDQETVAEIVNGFSRYFTDKHEIEILHSIDIILCKLIMGIRKRYKELSNGKQETAGEEKKAQGIPEKPGSVARNKGPRRKKGRDCRS
jgi:hypothetical protein